MAWWLMAVMPTRRPAQMRLWTMWAPQYVLPVPGGPWIEMQLPSRCVTHPHIASRSSENTPPGGPPPGGEGRVVPAEQAHRRRIGESRTRGAEHARGERVQGGGLRVRRDPVVVGDGRRVHAQLDRPVVPDQDHLAVGLVDVGDAGVPGRPVGRSVENRCAALPEVLRDRLWRPAEPGPRPLQLLALRAVPGLQSHELEPRDHVGIVEQLCRLEAGARQPSAPCGRGTRAPSSPAGPQADVRVCRARRHAARRPARRARDARPRGRGAPPATADRRAGGRRASRAGPASPGHRPRCRRRCAPGWRGRGAAMKCSYSTTAAAPWSISWLRS